MQLLKSVGRHPHEGKGKTALYTVYIPACIDIYGVLHYHLLIHRVEVAC